MPTLSAQLLGGFVLRIDRETVARLEQPRLQRLLAYLLLNRSTPVSRQHLAFLFWPDSTDAQARTNLRNLLHLLQKAWPESARWLDVSRGEVAWRAETRVEVDVAHFEENLAAGQSDGDTRNREAALRRAIESYGGDLLPDVYDDWALRERERLRLLYGQSLETLCVLLEEERRYAEAIGIAHLLVNHDPLQESAYRRLMHLHAQAGDRAAALRAYYTCATNLERELDVVPTRQTQEQYERLLHWTDRPLSERATSQNLPFVGRRAQWQQLLSAWKVTNRGKSHLFLIGGEAGVGKTRLAEELADWVRRQGFPTAGARCYAVGGALAYGPVAEWLRSAPLQSALGRVEDIWLVEIARLLPEVLEQRPELPRPGPLQESWQRQRFFEGLARLIAAAPQPLLLLLDDLQWADEETLTWLHFLLHSPLPLHLLVVGTVRLGEVRRRHPLAALLPQWQAAKQITEIELGPLTAQETARLAAHTTGAELSADAQEYLFRESEGNPLFLVEMLRAGEGNRFPDDEAARPSPNASSPAPAPLTPDRALLPVRIHAVITARLAQLSPPARQLAELAAVIGREFAYPLLAAASDVGDDALVQALDELWRRRLVREQGVDGYDFSHGRIRDVAYGELSRARLHLLHRRVAQALETLHAADLSGVAALLALHWEAAGDGATAAGHYLAAGEQALAAYLPRQALGYFERSAGLASAGLAGDERATADAHFGRGRALFGLEEFAAAISAFQDALALLDPTGARRGKVLYAIADVYYSALYDLAAAEPYIHQARAAAEAAQDWETLCQSLSLLGQLHSSQGELNQEERLIREALTIARRTHNRWREGRTLADFAFLQGQLSDFDAAESSARQSLALLRETDDRAGVAFAWNLLGRALGGRGAYNGAFAAFAQSEAIATESNQRSLLVQVPNMRGWLHQQLCDFSGALALNREGLALAQEWGKMTAEISARLNLCLDALSLGDPEQTLVDLEELAPKVGGKEYGYHAWRWRLRLLHAKGLCCLALGRVDEALTLAESGLALASSTGAQKYTALNRQLEGEALAAQGMGDRAVAALQQALALADRIEYQPLRWQSRFQLAQLHRQRDESEQAGALLTETSHIIRAMAAAVDDDPLRQIFLAAPPVAAVLEGAEQVQPVGHTFCVTIAE